MHARSVHGRVLWYVSIQASMSRSLIQVSFFLATSAFPQRKCSPMSIPYTPHISSHYICQKVAKSAVSPSYSHLPFCCSYYSSSQEQSGSPTPRTNRRRSTPSSLFVLSPSTLLHMPMIDICQPFPSLIVFLRT